MKNTSGLAPNDAQWLNPCPGIPVPFPLENKDGHDGKPVVRLHQQMFRNQQSLGVLQEGSGIIDGRTEIAGRAFAVLDGKGVIASMPFQPLVANSERVAIRGRNDRRRFVVVPPFAVA